MTLPVIFRCGVFSDSSRIVFFQAIERVRRVDTDVHGKRRWPCSGHNPPFIGTRVAQSRRRDSSGIVSITTGRENTVLRLRHNEYVKTKKKHAFTSVHEIDRDWFNRAKIAKSWNMGQCRSRRKKRSQPVSFAIMNVQV